MKLKLNNELQGSHKSLPAKKTVSLIKEERRRTGRYIAILVGISLFLLAMYHAWVRRIPVVASLVVPALIMFVYVAWVLYSASRDKHRLLDAEAALRAAAAQEITENEVQISEMHNNVETAPSSRDSTKLNSPEGSIHKDWLDISSVHKEDRNTKNEMESRIIMPIILINDKLPEDLDQKWTHVVQVLSNSERFKAFTMKRRYKRKFCRKKHAVYKRSYSIA